VPSKFDSKTSIREFFYSRDFILNVKIKMNNLLHQAVLSTNNISAQQVEQTTVENGVQLSKKYWVGGGNNSGIVKNVLKQRYWWQQGSDEDFASDVDFIWTSWKKNKHIEYLACAAKQPLPSKQSSPSTSFQPLPTISKQQHLSEPEPRKVLFKMYNRMEQNKQLTNKKGLFINMRRYYEMLGQDPF
jgi:hypothetical protein